MPKITKPDADKCSKSVILKVTVDRAQYTWLQQQAGRGNVSEFIRSKLFGAEYQRNTLPAARFSWELAVALNWVGNNLQQVTEKIDDLCKLLATKQPREAEIIAISAIVRLHQLCTKALIQISRSLAGKEDDDHPAI